MASFQWRKWIMTLSKSDVRRRYSTFKGGALENVSRTEKVGRYLPAPSCSAGLSGNWGSSLLNASRCISTTRAFGLGDFSGRQSARSDDWDGGETMATEMIRYCNSCREAETPEEALRVLEHGLSFLLNDGSGETAAGRVLLTMANLEGDRDKLDQAIQFLIQAGNLCSASPEVRVAAYEALAGESLKIHDHEMAWRHAKDVVYMAEATDRGDWSGRSPGLVDAMQARGLASVGLVELAIGNRAEAEEALREADSIWENIERTGSFRNLSLGAAKLVHALYAHSQGQLREAEEHYREALVRSQGLDDPSLVMTSLSMVPAEVAVGAQAGLGQLALHQGDFDEAEQQLTEAMRRAEAINGEKHPRVGVVLSLIAQVYVERARARGTGEAIMAEGLFRSAIDLLTGEKSGLKEYVKAHPLGDILPLTKARCSQVLSWAKGRGSEADRMLEEARREWRSPFSFADVAKAAPVTSNGTGHKHVSHSPIHPTRIPVVDARIGRVLL